MVPRKKVVCRTVCGSIELNVTLTTKLLTRPLRHALVNPFIDAYNKRRPDEPPLSASTLARVEVDGQLTANRSEWTRGATDFLTERFADEKNRHFQPNGDPEKYRFSEWF